MTHSRSFPTPDWGYDRPGLASETRSRDGDRSVSERAAGREYWQDGTLRHEWAAGRVTIDKPTATHLPRTVVAAPAGLWRTWRWIVSWVKNVGVLAGLAAVEALVGWAASQLDPTLGWVAGVIVAVVTLAACGAEAS